MVSINLKDLCIPWDWGGCGGTSSVSKDCKPTENHHPPNTAPKGFRQSLHDWLRLRGCKRMLCLFWLERREHQVKPPLGLLELACVVELHWSWCSGGKSLPLEVTAACCERDVREAFVGGKATRSSPSLMLKSNR
eukprot:5427194-Amphidinium_carterae.3